MRGPLAVCESQGSTWREVISEEQTRTCAPGGQSARSRAELAISRPTRKERQVACTLTLRMPEPPSPSAACSSGPPSGMACSFVPLALTIIHSDSGGTPAASSAAREAWAAIVDARSPGAAKRRSATPERTVLASKPPPPRAVTSSLVTTRSGT